MSKSSTATAPKIPAPLTSAWARGPPQSTSASATASPRSASPAPNTPTTSNTPSHSRRPSTLGQGIPGVSVARTNSISLKHGSSPSVTFGSIDDASAPISSSPANAPAFKKPVEGVKSFGTLPANSSNSNSTSAAPSTSNSNSTAHVNGKPSSGTNATTTKPPASGATKPSPSPAPATEHKRPNKMDISKLFQTPSSSASSPAPTPSASSATLSPAHHARETAPSPSPSMRPASLPLQQHGQGQPHQHQGHAPQTPSQLHAYTQPFVPGGSPSGGRGQQQNGNQQQPRSPVYGRNSHLPNGRGGSGGTPNSPRISHAQANTQHLQHPQHQHPGQHPQHPQQPHPGQHPGQHPQQMYWTPQPGQYPPPQPYPGMPPEYAMAGVPGVQGVPGVGVPGQPQYWGYAPGMNAYAPAPVMQQGPPNQQQTMSPRAGVAQLPPPPTQQSHPGSPHLAHAQAHQHPHHPPNQPIPPHQQHQPHPSSGSSPHLPHQTHSHTPSSLSNSTSTPHAPPPPPQQQPPQLQQPQQQYTSISSPSPFNPPSNVSSPPATPLSAASALKLNSGANAFVPSGPVSKKINIKKPDGSELNLREFASSAAVKPVTPPIAASPAATPANMGGKDRRSIVRMESVEERNRRIGLIKEEEEKLKREKEEAEAKVKEEEERKKREEEEKIRRQMEEEERLRKEEERVKREEEERVRKEEEEKERLRKAEEERKEKVRLEEEAKAKVEAEAQAKAKAEAEAKAKAEEDAKAKAEALKVEEEAKKKAEAEAAAAAAVAESAKDDSAAAVKEEPEEGELVEDAAPATTAASPATEEKKKDLRIDTAAPKPSLGELRGKKPGRLDLTTANQKGLASPLKSALATARIIEDLGSVTYPEGILSPKPELNVNAKEKKFRYDRDFLMQFMAVCKDKPDMLPPLDAIGLEPTEQHYAMSRGGSGRHRQSSAGMGPPGMPQRTNSGLGLGIGFGGKAGPGGFSMGNFSTPNATKMSSEERFAMANNGRVASVGAGGPAGMQFGGRGQNTPMARSTSQSGMGSNRTRSKRGEKRNEGNKVGGHQPHQGGGGGGYHQQQQQQGLMNLEPVAPLQASENRWVAGSATRKPVAVDENSPEIVDRKVKALLNKLTMEKFDSISDQIITWANKSETEKDGRTLIQVIRLVFEKATDEAAWSEMYARLCRKMMEQISPKVQDDGIKNQEGKPFAGGQLFRKYLLNRCQEDFERGWVQKEATAAAAVAKATEDEVTKAANEGSKDGEVALYSDEYYAAQKAKRQGLGLIKFIGELFKLQMLTERIMHECVKKLLGNVDNPEEEEIESLCKLLTTVGELLDNPKARAHMDVYFARMRELTKSPNVNSRMQFMLQELLELRGRKWQSRHTVAAPATLAQVHEAAAREKATAEKESYARQMSMSRGGSRRGNERPGGDFQGPDGWTTAGSAAPRPPAKAGDLSQFGKINKPGGPLNFGPTSVFNKKDAKSAVKEPLSRTASSSNMFSMLSNQTPDVSADAAKAAPAEPMQRKKLQLMPRTKPVTGETPPPESGPASAVPSDEETLVDAPAVAGPSMSEADAKKKIEEDLKEFFAVRNLEEADEYFLGLPSEHHFMLVDKLVSSAVESKEPDVDLVASFFERAANKSVCSPQSFEDGFLPIAEFLDDISVDAPKAFNFFVKMMIKGSGVDKDEERRKRISSKAVGCEERLLEKLS